MAFWLHEGPAPKQLDRDPNEEIAGLQVQVGGLNALVTELRTQLADEQPPAEAPVQTDGMTWIGGHYATHKAPVVAADLPRLERPDLEGDVVADWAAGDHEREYGETCSHKAGTQKRPLVYRAGPDSQFIVGKVGIAVGNSEHVVFDGFKIRRATADRLEHAITVVKCDHITFLNCTGSGFRSGVKVSHCRNITFQNCCFDNNSAHGAYVARREGQSHDIRFIQCLFWGNGYHGLQANGEIYKLGMLRCVAHSNGLAGVNLVNGPRDALIQHNLMFNNGRGGIMLCLYTDSHPGIGTYDLLGNNIISNTIWQGRYAWADPGNIAPSGRPCIDFSDYSTGEPHEIRDTYIARNILASQDEPPVRFRQERDIPSTKLDRNWLWRAGGFEDIPIAVDEGKDERHYRVDTAIERFGLQATDNEIIRPPFANVSVDYAAEPERFNFRLKEN